MQLFKKFMNLDKSTAIRDTYNANYEFHICDEMCVSRSCWFVLFLGIQGSMMILCENRKSLT